MTGEVGRGRFAAAVSQDRKRVQNLSSAPGPSADHVFEANLGFECGIRRVERHAPRLITDNAIGRDMAPSLERLYRGSRVRPEVAVNALRRRVPLSGRSVGQHLLKAADNIAG
jgi:hypothetical protein